MVIFTIDGYYNTIMNMLPFKWMIHWFTMIYLWNIAIFAGNAGFPEAIDSNWWLSEAPTVCSPGLSRMALEVSWEDHELWLVDFRASHVRLPEKKNAEWHAFYGPSLRPAVW